uniref:Zinc ABC transporter substrate-binding protein n=1 Tax=Staphylothermus marinus TaxID=2280 RepID=A0A7C4D6W5_STAMA
MYRDQFISLFFILLVTIFCIEQIYSNNNGLLIVTTFPNLVNDLEGLICDSDRVVSIVPFGIDPHDYSLKPGDIEFISNSDLVILTGHVDFELKIERFYENRKESSQLINLIEIPGLNIKLNPVTSGLNYHMPIYDPINYVLFIKYVVNRLELLNPRCKDVYREKSYLIIDKVLDIYFKTPRLNKTALVDYPYVQYAIEWIGFRIINILIKEHGLEITPDLSYIERIIYSKEVDYIVVTEPIVSEYSIWLYRKAVENNIPVLKVYSPYSNNSFVEKLMYLYSQLVELTNQSVVLEKQSFRNISLSNNYKNVLEQHTFVIGLIVFVLTIYIVVKRDILG